MRLADPSKSLLNLLLASTTLMLWFAVQAGPTPHERFQAGWRAYEQGDYQRAASVWQPLAEQGYVNAQINLAALYEQGRGVARDLERAGAWYLAAARQDSPIGQYNLGLFLAEHGGGAGAPARDALHWLGKAAAQGFADAQFQIGLMYARGMAGEGGHAEAPHWLYQAGLGYLSGDDAAGVASAVAALDEVASGAPLARDLEGRLASSGPAGSGQAIAAPHSATGTAWPVVGGYVVTNHHIVAGKRSVMLVDTRGTQIPARVVLSDVRNDVALLAAEDPAQLPPALPLAATAARLGASVFTIGFPRVDVMGITPKLSLGIISGVNGMRDDPSSYQISVPIQPGNSGGPLINMRGEVVGLVTAMLGRVSAQRGQAEPLANIGYALKIERVETLIDAAPRPLRVLVELERGAQPLEVLAQRIQNSVMMVRAE